jgi:hypothetical protein
MNSPARDTAGYLAAQGVTGAVGGSSGWPVYVGREPLTPVDVVTCYDTGGPVGPLIDLRRPSVQVRVRSANYDDGWQKINEAYEALVLPTSVSGSDVVILGWMAISDVAFIGRDDKDRAIFTVNFETLRDGAAA